MKGIYVITIAFLAFWTEITAKENQLERSVWTVGFWRYPKIPKICPLREKDEHTTTNLPHENDCTKFYKCFLGEGVSQNCPLMIEGDPITRLHYNSLEQVCDWPWRAACDHCPEQENGNWPRKYRISHETDKCGKYYDCIKGKKHLKYCRPGTCFSRTCQECVQDPRGGKCRRCIEGKKTRHEFKCNLYYMCINGENYLQFCPNGLYFDSKSQNCTSPKISDCPYPYCTEGEKTRHECKCNLYYKCINDEQTRQSCADGRHFDSRINNCTTPEKSDCPYSNCIEGEKTHHECNCNLYYKCINEKEVKQRCPDGFHFDSRSQDCTTPDKSDCRKQCIKGEKTRHECKCNIYYECINDKKVRRFCPDGFHFDFKTQRCTVPNESDCPYH